MAEPRKLYRKIDEVIEEANDRIRRIASGQLVPIVTSVAKEREHIGGFFGGEQVVIAARTGAGKTAKVVSDVIDFVNPLLNPFYAGRIAVLWDTWEMESWRNVTRMYSNLSEYTIKQITAYKEGERLTAEQVEYFTNDVASHFRGLPIYFNQISTDVEDWKKMKEQYIGEIKQKLNPSGNAINDPLVINVVDHTRLGRRLKEKSEEELITAFQIAGMQLKNEHKCLNIFLSQFNRKIEEGVDRDDPIKIGRRMPIASDIFGSDAVFQCADIVTALHRPGAYGIPSWQFEPNGPEHVIIDAEGNDLLMLEVILKQRDGIICTIPLEHKLKYSKFLDFDMSAHINQHFF